MSTSSTTCCHTSTASTTTNMRALCQIFTHARGYMAEWHVVSLVLDSTLLALSRVGSSIPPPDSEHVPNDLESNDHAVRSAAK